MSYKIYFNSCWSSLEEQKRLHELLPVSHLHGDRASTLQSGQILRTRDEHEVYAPSDLRIRTRKRCTVACAEDKNGTHITLGFLSTTDWHGVGLDAEAFFLRPSVPQNIMPRIGPYSFYFGVFIASMYEDITMAFAALKATVGQSRVHLKIVPLGVGPTIRTRYGDFLASQTIPAYLQALRYACNEHLHNSWVDTLEFIDHAHGTLCPYVSIPGVRVMSCSQRDVFDFSGSNASPVILAPCDSFCVIGGLDTDKSIASSIARGSNLRSVLSSDPTFVPWPQ